MATQLIPVEEVIATARPTPLPRKKLVRREAPDRSQRYRRGFQAAFVLLNVAIGVQFCGFVRYCESGGASRFVARPAGVEGWLPIAGLMNWKVFLLTGGVSSVHPAGMVLFGAFAVICLLFRRAFCSWLCPIGTLSEYLWKLGRRLLGRNLVAPRWLDIPLRGLKYLLLGFFVNAVWTMSADEIASFMRSPYGLIADVKMLNFFRDLSQTAAIVLFALAMLSLLVQNFWCRYLCPYGAFLGIISLVSPARIRRNPQACIDCAMCAKACPAALKVDKLLQVRSAECTGCLECVAVCPAEGALQLSLPARRKLPAWALAAGIAAIFFGGVGYAKLTHRWSGSVSRRVYLELVPEANAASHPMPGDLER